MEIEEAKEAATALLATVKHLMIAREIEACEWAKSDEMESDIAREIRHLQKYGEEDDYRSLTPREAEVMALRETDKIHTLRRLKTQFSREIGDWIDKPNAARARKVIRPAQQPKLHGIAS